MLRPCKDSAKQYVCVTHTKREGSASVTEGTMIEGRPGGGGDRRGTGSATIIVKGADTAGGAAGKGDAREGDARGGKGTYTYTYTGR